MRNTHDVIIIGTGQAGPALARRLATAGHDVAILERARFGGTCVNTGCIPTKTLVASARAAHVTRRAEEFGVRIYGSVSVDMRLVKARKDEIVQRSSTGVERSLRNHDNITVYQGHGRFVSPHDVRVGDDVLHGDKIFINVGSRPAIPDMPGIADVPFLTNSDMLDLETLPEHLIVVGGSYVGLEFAQMFRRFGSDVTIVHRGSRLVPREDEDVSNAILEILQREGIQVRLNAECVRLERRSGRVAMGVDCQSGAPELLGSHVLMATGRKPNTDDLGLDRAGVEHDERGYIQVTSKLLSNVPGIWALGDCNGHGGFTHTAWNDYEIVAANLLDGADRKHTDRIPAYGLFIDPPLGRVGMTETQVRSAELPALMATRPMSRIGRAVEMGETQGFMKILVHAESERLLGAAILGVGGDEIVHSLLDLMYADAPYTLLSRAVHIHPTVSELIPTTLEGLKPLD